MRIDEYLKNIDMRRMLGYSKAMILEELTQSLPSQLKTYMMKMNIKTIRYRDKVGIQ